MTGGYMAMNVLVKLKYFVHAREDSAFDICHKNIFHKKP